MNTRYYPIIKPLYNSKKSKWLMFLIPLIVMILIFFLGLLLAIHLNVIFALVWLFIFLIPNVLNAILIKKLYAFEIVGSIECKVNRFVITVNDQEEVFDLKDIKGFNIGMQIRNPSANSGALMDKHNAYKIILKCSLERQIAFHVFNYKDPNKIRNDIYDLNFLGELKYYRKQYYLRFWNMKGDPFVGLY